MYRFFEQQSSLYDLIAECSDETENTLQTNAVLGVSKLLLACILDDENVRQDLRPIDSLDFGIIIYALFPPGKCFERLFAPVPVVLFAGILSNVIYTPKKGYQCTNSITFITDNPQTIEGPYLLLYGSRRQRVYGGAIADWTADTGLARSPKSDNV